MAFTTFSGPVRSLNGFAVPIIYVSSTSVSPLSIPAGASVVILSPADGGPAAEFTLVLPLVTTTNGGAFTINNADASYAGVRGDVLNYGAVAHLLKGASSQPVNENAAGAVIAGGTAVQWGGNGNPAAPWAAVASALCANK